MDLSSITFLDGAAFITGVVFLLLQVFHSKWMWWFEIVTCGLQTIIFIKAGAWGNAALQIYFVVMSVIGIFQWKRDAKKVSAGKIHINKLELRSTLTYIVLLIAGGGAISLLLYYTGSASPVLEGIVMILGIVATVWLTRSYIQQWYLWFEVDALQVVFNLVVGNYTMAALYVFYFLASVAGLIYWKRNGEMVSE